MSYFGVMLKFDDRCSVPSPPNDLDWGGEGTFGGVKKSLESMRDRMRRSPQERAECAKLGSLNSHHPYRVSLNRIVTPMQKEYLLSTIDGY